MRRISFIVALLLFASPVYAQAVPDDAGLVVVPALVDAGPTAPTVITTTTTEIKPSDVIVNPAEHPVQALGEAKAARKSGWAMLLFFCLVAITKALAYGRDKLAGLPLLGKAATWLATGKRAVLVAGLAAVGAAGYDILAGGGTVTAALFAAVTAYAAALHSTTKGA